MARFVVNFRFQARAARDINAESLAAAQEAIEREVNADGFHIDADDIDDVDFTVKEDAGAGGCVSYYWLMAPHEYEPDYEAYWRDLESLEEAMANVGAYEDWFVEYEQ